MTTSFWPLCWYLHAAFTPTSFSCNMFYNADSSKFECHVCVERISSPSRASLKSTGDRTSTLPPQACTPASARSWRRRAWSRLAAAYPAWPRVRPTRSTSITSCLCLWARSPSQKSRVWVRASAPPAASCPHKQVSLLRGQHKLSQTYRPPPSHKSSCVDAVCWCKANLVGLPRVVTLKSKWTVI